tara:strand:+ start:152 stop:697 length:546 start_codon:yes stop_codon:yes gene_type:complete
VHSDYLTYFTEWVICLREEKFFGAEDALFPKPEQRLVDGRFVYDQLSRDPYANSAQVSAVFRGAFAQVQLHPYTPHSIRKTLGQEMSDRNLPLDAQKAWSQILGHERFTTTVSSYLPVSTQQQGFLHGQLAHKKHSALSFHCWFNPVVEKLSCSFVARKHCRLNDPWCLGIAQKSFTLRTF